MINFDASTHTYTNEKGEKYTSVSTLIGKYKKPFDANFFSMMSAKKRGISQAAVLAEWKGKTDVACGFGKDVHGIVEEFIKTGKIVDELIISEFHKVFPYDLRKVLSEKVLYSDNFKLAGTSDIIVDVDKDTFDVLDIKTNKSFDFYSKYKEYLLKPLDHLQNCKYSSYSLQLSLYAWMYSKITGKKPRKLSVLYWDKTKFIEYVSPYMFWEVSVLLKHYSESNSINN